MKTCKTCKFWMDRDEDELKPEGWKLCYSKLINSTGDGGCVELYQKYEVEGKIYDDFNSITFGDNVKAENVRYHGLFCRSSRNDAGFMDCNSDYSVDFFTGPNFGCIHHEEIKL